MSSELTKYVLDIVENDSCVKVSYMDVSDPLGRISPLSEQMLEEQAERVGLTTEELLVEMKKVEEKIRMMQRRNTDGVGDHYFLLLEMVKGDVIQ